jgi:hypothetical protein
MTSPTAQIVCPSTSTSATVSVVDLSAVPKLESKLDVHQESSLEPPTGLANAAATTTEPSPTAPPGIICLKVVLLIAFSIANFLDVAAISSLYSAVPVLTSALGLTGNQGDWLLGAYQLTFSSFMLLSGRLTDIYNPSKRHAQACSYRRS